MSSVPYFQHHPNFIEELSEFIDKHCPGRTTAEQTIGYIQNLLTKHFYLKSPMFTPKNIGLAQGFGGYEIYWLHLYIPNSGLSKTQNPKAYFYKTELSISFLCLDSHIENYKDSKLREIAKERLFDMIKTLQ